MGHYSTGYQIRHLLGKMTTSCAGGGGTGILRLGSSGLSCVQYIRSVVPT